MNFSGFYRPMQQITTLATLAILAAADGSATPTLPTVFMHGMVRFSCRSPATRFFTPSFCVFFPPPPSLPLLFFLTQLFAS